MPELTALEVLVTVAAQGSLNGAARQLGISQQAVSARVAALERQTGVPLLVRSTRGSTLTTAGTAVAAWATRLLAQAAELDAGLAALRADVRTTLRIAASLTVAEYLLPAWLVALQAESVPRGTPPIAVELRVENTQRVAEQVRASEVDLGFVEGEGTPAGLRGRAVARDRLVVVVPPAHPWAAAGAQLTARALAATPLVARELGSGTRDVFEAALRRQLEGEVEFAAPALTLSSTTSIRAAVIAGAGPGVLSELAVQEDLESGRLLAVDLPGVELSRTLRCVWRGESTPPAPAARALLRVAVSAANARRLS